MSRFEIPATRIRALNEHDVRADRDYVMLWLVGARRLVHSFTLDHALDLCQRTGKPLLVYEAVRVGYPHASQRLHKFILDGMRHNQEVCARHDVRYFPYVEPEADAGKGLVKALAKRACAVVTDDWPCFFVPRMLRAAADQVDVRMEAVDGNGLLPIRQPGKLFTRAYDLRRHLQKNLPDHLDTFPEADPLSGKVDVSGANVARKILDRWPAATQDLLEGTPEALSALPIDDEVLPTEWEGGPGAGASVLETFLRRRLSRYAEDGNHPDEEATSNLSPYLHFGHVGTHQVFSALMREEEWSPSGLGDQRKGSRGGFWNMSEGAEAFLDQLVTWRELGFNQCVYNASAYDSFTSLPDWARATLAEHEGDKREHLYERRELEAAETHDEVWNAAQNQLREDGVIHNYMRMLWGKNILAWSPNAETAARRLVHLNDRWALDGRDPNSYSGIFWVLGRHDRPWGPERKVFGKIRYMTSENTKRKLKLGDYLSRYR